MPNLNILTWNPNGESLHKATWLTNTVLPDLTNQGTTPDVIVIQEANSFVQGFIYLALQNAGYTVYRIPEGGRQGRSYLLAVGPNATVQTLFTQWFLNRDQGVINWLNGFNNPLRSDIQQELNNFRNLGTVELTVGGTQIGFSTWHAPRGVTHLQTVPSKLSGGGNPAAYVALAASDLYNQWYSMFDFSVLAGDLNVKHGDLNMPIVVEDDEDFEILDRCEGYDHNLESILAMFNTVNGQVVNAQAFRRQGRSHGEHDALFATIQW